MARQDAAPLYASERSAARLLDMRPAEFRALVDAGALPRPSTIAGQYERWRVADLDAVLSGKIPKPPEEFEF